MIDNLKNASAGLKSELSAALLEESKCDCLMFKNTLKKTEKSSTMPAVSMLMFLAVYVILLLFLFPIWPDDWIIYTNLALGGFTMIFWLMSMFSNPGVIKKPADVDFLKLMQIVDPI